MSSVSFSCLTYRSNSTPEW